MTAWINNNLCGQTNIFPLQGKLAYQVQVLSEAVFPPYNGCGTQNVAINFKVGNWWMDNDRNWNNSQAWYNSLDTILITPAIANLTIAKQGNDIALNWQHFSQNRGYEVWRSADRYFSPGDPSSSLLGNLTAPTNVFTDVNVLNQSSDFYYHIKASNALGDITSNRMGLVNYSFQVGWDLVGPNLEKPGALQAESILDEITNGGGNCTEIDRWFNSGWDAHIHNLPFNNFAVVPGQGFFFRCPQASDWQLVGMVPNTSVTLSFGSGWNLISLPYLPATKSAEQMLDEITSQGGNCSEVDRWFNSGWDAHIHNLPFNDFVLDEAEGYFVRCTQSSSYVP